MMKLLTKSLQFILISLVPLTATAGDLKKEPVAFVISLKGNVLINQKKAERTVALFPGDRVLVSGPAADNYLEFVNLYGSPEAKLHYKITAANSPHMVSAKSANDQGLFNRIVSLFSQENGETHDILITRGQEKPKLRPVYPRDEEKFYGLAGNKMWFSWKDADYSSRKTRYVVSIRASSQKVMTAKASEMEACFATENITPGKFSWTVTRLGTERSFTAACYLMPEAERKRLAEELPRFSPDVPITVQILQTVEFLLQRNLDYDACMMLRSWSEKYPDVTLCNNLLERITNRRHP